MGDIREKALAAYKDWVKNEWTDEEINFGSESIMNPDMASGFYAGFKMAFASATDEIVARCKKALIGCDEIGVDKYLYALDDVSRELRGRNDRA